MVQSIESVKSVCCPYCQSTNFIRRGKVDGNQRYKCKLCRRSFRDTTMTAMHHIHKKARVERYLQALSKGMSVRKAAKFAGISKNTSFAWRHKFLSSLANKPEPKEENTVVGATILRLPYSAKGRKKEPEKDRRPIKSLILATNSQIWISRINNKQPTISSAQIISRIFKKSHISTVHDNLLTRSVKLQSNAKQINLQFLKDSFLQEVVDAECRLVCWMKRFRGVASKYLQHYWSWFVCLSNGSKIKDGLSQFNLFCTNYHCLDNYNRVKRQ